MVDALVNKGCRLLEGYIFFNHIEANEEINLALALARDMSN